MVVNVTDAVPCSPHTKSAGPLPSFFNRCLIEEDKVAENFQMGENKNMYFVSYGLFPNFR